MFLKLIAGQMSARRAPQPQNREREAEVARWYRHILRSAVAAGLLCALVLWLGPKALDDRTPVMRREHPKAMMPVVASAVLETSEAIAPSEQQAPGRPRLMRHEPPRSNEPSVPRPSAWGKFFRKEAPPQAAAAAGAAAEVMAAPAGQARLMVGIVVAVVALLGFALQLKNLVLGLLQVQGGAGKKK